MNTELITEDIVLPIEKIEKIKNDMKCYKCKKIIYKTFGSYRICQDCRYELSKLNNEKQKIKRTLIKEKKPRKYNTKEFDYKAYDGTMIKINAKSENKTCKKCLITKNY